MLVTFGDIADPASVRLVNPGDLAASFGPGVRLKAVTLEVTEAAVTAGVVEGVLSWIDGYRENQWRLNGEKCVACPVTSETLADLMSAGDFIQRP